MYDLKSIIERNREAVRLGVVKPGELVGTRLTATELEHPWSIQPTIADEGSTRYVVRNYDTGFQSCLSHATYDEAEAEARSLIAGEPL